MVQSSLGHVHRPVRRLVLLLPRRTPPDSYPGQPPWLERLAFNVQLCVSTFGVWRSRARYLGMTIELLLSEEATAKI